jgi:hypothetical protein
MSAVMTAPSIRRGRPDQKLFGVDAAEPFEGIVGRDQPKLQCHPDLVNLVSEKLNADSRAAQGGNQFLSFGAGVSGHD